MWLSALTGPEERGDADATDLALVASYQRGNGNALAELYRRHGRRVESIARNLMGQSSELEDVVQEVFIELQRALFKFRGDSRFTTWLHRVTVNVALMHLRTQRRKGWLRWVGLDQVDALPAVVQQTEGRLDARDTCKQLYDILGRLAEKKYVVFALYELEGMSLDEIATTLDIGLNTVKSRLFHARKEVFELAEERGVLPPFALQVVK